MALPQIHHNRLFFGPYGPKYSKLRYGIRRNGWAHLPSKNYNFEIFTINSFNMRGLSAPAR